MTKKELQSGLLSFSGLSKRWHRHQSGLVYSDGVKWLCDNNNCNVLIDDISAFQDSDRVGNNIEMQDFQLWILWHDQFTHVSILYGMIDENIPPLIEHNIPILLPLDVIRLHVINSVLILPTENI
jgi:hypothetical protein